jgi:Tfp pilus assembly protein PilE
MRIIFGLVSLLIVAAIVGVLAKKQLSAVTALPAANPNAANSANIAEQSKLMQQQVKDQLNEAMKATAEAREKALESGNSDRSTDKPADKTGSAY